MIAHKGIGSGARVGAALIAAAAFALLLALSGCGGQTASTEQAELPHKNEKGGADHVVQQEEGDANRAAQHDVTDVTPGHSMEELAPGLSMTKVSGDRGLSEFVAQGGASSDAEVVSFLEERMAASLPSDSLFAGAGCSTLLVKDAEAGVLFGRNFDWHGCDALIVEHDVAEGYDSVSTVNLDFLKSAAGSALGNMPDEVVAQAALFAPLDGMNEAGLAVATLMIEDSDTIDQATDKPDLTTTTAVRLLLDAAANVEEALDVLAAHDLHGSMGLMVHFAIADAEGNGAVVEYVDNEMQVVESDVATNFYLSDGPKKGIGTSQSHDRFAALRDQLDSGGAWDEQRLRDAMESVSKKNYPDGETTEWTMACNLTAKDVVYYHREDYGQGWRIRLGS